MSAQAGLSEIFAAVGGIISVGAELCRQGIKIDDHPLTSIAAEGASALYQAQYTAATRPVSALKTQDHIARPLVKFLEMALPVLESHDQTEQVGQLRDHVRDIIAREEAGGLRRLEGFKEGGVPRKIFKATYMQAGQCEVVPKADAQTEARKRGGMKQAATVAESFSYRRRTPIEPAAFV